MTTEGENGRSFERWVQLAAGLAMWAFLMYSDHQSTTDIMDLSTAQVMISLGKYAFAAILIKGVTAKELADLLRAWRGAGSK